MVDPFMGWCYSASMARKKDETGNRYGRLVVRHKVASRDKSAAWWECVCDCGSVIQISANKLRTGHTKSCGCLKQEVISQGTNRLHGMSKTRTYRTWKEMKGRCYRPTASQYKWYGGRGVSVCERWGDFARFLADMGERPPGKTLDRINPDGDYEPSNCRWATPKEQAAGNRGCFAKGSTPWNKRIVLKN